MIVGTLSFFSLSTDYEAVLNSTTRLKYYDDSTQGTFIPPISKYQSLKIYFELNYQQIKLASTEPPTFGPYNMIMCRPGTIFSYETTFSTGQGAIFAFDVFIYSPANTIQNLVSLRNFDNNYVSLTTYYDPIDSKIKVKLQNPDWGQVLVSSTINPGTSSIVQW